MEKKLSELEVDQLAEITNIGAGNASTALSHMLGVKIEMTVPESFIGSIEEIQHKLGDSNDKVVSVFLKMEGDIEGAMVMMFTPTATVDFISMLTKSHIDNLEKITEIEKSALLEIGNILLGASITALGKFLDLNILHSIPDMAIDMLGAIMDSVLLEMGSESEKILAFRINLHLEDKKVGGDLYYFFDPKSSQKILSITKTKIS